MHPNLVGAAGFQLHAQQGAAALLPQGFPVGHRSHAGRVNTSLHGAVRAVGNGCVYGAAAGIGAGHHRIVILLYLSGQLGGAQLVPGQYHQAAGVLVQPVNGPERAIKSGGCHCVGQGIAVVIVGLVHGHTGALVHHQNIPVGIDDHCLFR